MAFLLVVCCSAVVLRNPRCGSGAAARAPRRAPRSASSARCIAASTVTCVVSTTGTASPGARPRWIIDSIETCSSRKRGGDIGDDAGLIDHHQADVVGALVPLHRRARACRASAAAGTPKAGTCRPRGDVDEVGGDRRGGRERRRRRGPCSTTRPTKSPSATTALNTPSTAAIGVARGTMQGCTRCSSPCSVSRAMPSSLMR